MSEIESDLKNKLKTILSHGNWTVKQFHPKEDSSDFEIKLLFENLPGILIWDFFRPNLINELIPNQQSQTININSMGFRGEEFSIEKPENVYRIFMLGGSTMFGHGATSDQTTIPGYLQELFQNYSEGFDIEIINKEGSELYITKEAAIRENYEKAKDFEVTDD